MGGFHRLYYAVIDGTTSFQTLQKQLEFITAHLAYTSKPNLLDIGCGTGRLCFLLAERNFNVTGIDRSSFAISVAQSRMEGCSFSNIHFICGDFKTYNFPFSHFDLVYYMGGPLTGPFDNIGEDEFLTLLKKIYNVLKGGGFFIFDSLRLERLVKKRLWKNWALINDVICISDLYFNLQESTLEGKQIFLSYNKEKIRRVKLFNELKTIFKKSIKILNPFISIKHIWDKKGKYYDLYSFLTILNTRIYLYHIKIYPSEEEVRKCRLKVYSVEKLKEIATMAGFKVYGIYDDLDGNVYNRKGISTSIYFVLQKSG